jgi:hypothetical protein
MLIIEIPKDGLGKKSLKRKNEEKDWVIVSCRGTCAKI